MRDNVFQGVRDPPDRVPERVIQRLPHTTTSLKGHPRPGATAGDQEVAARDNVFQGVRDPPQDHPDRAPRRATKRLPRGNLFQGVRGTLLVGGKTHPPRRGSTKHTTAAHPRRSGSTESAFVIMGRVNPPQSPEGEGGEPPLGGNGSGGAPTDLKNTETHGPG